MFRERYSRRRRWIIGSVVLCVAVVIMILTPPQKLLELVLNDNLFETRRSRGAEPFEFNHTIVPATEPVENVARLPLPLPPAKPEQTVVHTSNPFQYVEEPPVDDEMKRLMTGLSTQGAVCADLRRIGGLPRGPHGAPRPLGPDGMWYVCFDKEVELDPMSCIVYSVGTGDDFSFDDAMGAYGCDVFAFDPSMGKDDHNHSASVMFLNLALSDVNQERAKNGSFDLGRNGWKTRTLSTIISELGHSKREIDILKIDIEADEWKCLPQMLTEGTLKSHVRQLNIEYHVIMKTPEALRGYYSIAKWLERQGFKIFHTRRNPYCPVCWEMSYVNTNLVKLPLN